MQIVFMFLICLVGSAHAASNLSVDSISLRGKNARGEVIDGDKITMPYVRADDKKVAANINDALYLDRFGMLAPANPGKFVHVTDSTQFEGIAAQEFEITRRDDRILTVAFEGEGCGAYCENYQSYYSFDVTTGRLLNPDDLMTAPGMRALALKMHNEKLAQYRHQLAKLRTTLKDMHRKKSQKDMELVDGLKERIEFNTGCLQREADEETTDKNLLDAFSTFRVHLEEKAFHLISSRCSNHADHGIDDVDEVEVTLSYPSLKPYLTAYGKAILLNEGSAKPTTILGQVLRGKLGWNTITMFLTEAPDHSISGMYFYDKYRKPIRINGQQQDHQLLLTEYANDTDEAKATMRLSISGANIKGQWSGKSRFEVNLVSP